MILQVNSILKLVATQVAGKDALRKNALTFSRCTRQSCQTFTVPPGPQCVHRSMLGLKFGLIVEVSDPWEVPPNADLV